jgi:hypothetical protein
MVDLSSSELARSLRMPGPEGHVQNYQHCGKNELKPHFRFLLVCAALPEPIML